MQIRKGAMWPMLDQLPPHYPNRREIISKMVQIQDPWPGPNWGNLYPNYRKATHDWLKYHVEEKGWKVDHVIKLLYHMDAWDAAIDKNGSTHPDCCSKIRPKGLPVWSK